MHIIHTAIWYNSFLKTTAAYGARNKFCDVEDFINIDEMDAKNKYQISQNVVPYKIWTHNT